MIVGIDQNIKPGPFQGSSKFIRTGEGRIAFVRFSCKCDLQVPDYKVGPVLLTISRD